MKTYKRGEINEDTGMVFSHYIGNGRIQWLSIEAWNKKKERQKEYNKSDKSKEYQKEWYLNNKFKKLEQSKINKEIRIKESPLKILFSLCKASAKRRNKELSFEIDINFIINKWKEQEGKCYYTKLDMKCTSSKKDPFQVSIDRVNSALGYTPENTVLCCQSINYMKNDYTIEDFIIFLNALKKV